MADASIWGKHYWVDCGTNSLDWQTWKKYVFSGETRNFCMNVLSLAIKNYTYKDFII